MARSANSVFGSASLAVLAVLTYQPAAAQETADEAKGLDVVEAQNDDGAGLGEIIVTAQRRSENAQNVPIAIQSVTSELAVAAGVTSTETLGQLLPGVTLNRQGNGLIPFVRGVGVPLGGTAGNEPSVALFVDDVYIPTSQAAVFDFNNIDSISVLKGPQGTLFGRNATGGVIQVKTLDPSQTPEFRLDLSYANYDKVTGAIYGNMPISDAFAANLAAYGTKQHDGWGRNVLTGREIFKTESYGFRGKIGGEIGPDTKILLSANYDYRDSDQGGLSQNILPGTFGTGGFSPEALGAGFYDGVTDFGPIRYTADVYGASVKIEHDFGNAQLRSISAYGKVRTFVLTDLEASPSPFVNTSYHQGSSAFTQEIQLLSNDDTSLKWILGAFYFHDKSFFDIVSTGTAYGNRTSRGRSDQLTNSLSGYGQVTATILPRVNLTLGLRFTSDWRDYEASGSLDAAQSPLFRDDAHYTALTGRAALDFKVSDDVMAYVAYNKGFKSGLFNLSAITGNAASAPPAILPEELNAYSLGFKSEFFDRRLRLNVEGFWYDYTNIQVSTVVAGATVIRNAAAASIKGIDVDLTFKPVRALTLSASVSIADGHYKSFPDGPQFFPLPPNAPIAFPAGCAATVPTYPTGAGTLTQRPCDLSGNKTIQTVPFSSTLTAIYTVPTDVGEFGLTASWAHGGNYFFEADNNAAVRQPRTDIVNGSINWTSSSEAFGLSFWVNNLTKERYYNSLSQSTLGGQRYSPAAPRTYGVTARLRF